MEIFEVVNAETIRDAKIPWSSDLIKLPYIYGNFMSFFLTKFYVQL